MAFFDPLVVFDATRVFDVEDEELTSESASSADDNDEARNLFLF